MKAPSDPVIIQLYNSRQILHRYFEHFISQQGRTFEWRREYDEVADWLSNNQGKGVLLYGSCGLGKTMLGQYVLPAILLKHCNKVTNCYTTTEMNRKPEEALSKKIVSIDDIGTENESNIYGNKRMVLPELADEAERHSKLLIITTNLGGQELGARYGERAFDRLCAITRRVEFRGKSYRR